MANLIKNIIPASIDALLRQNGYDAGQLWSKDIVRYESHNRRLIMSQTDIDFHAFIDNEWTHIATVQMSIALDYFCFALLLHSIGSISLFAFDKIIWQQN